MQRPSAVAARILAAGAIVAFLDLFWAGLVWVVVLQKITAVQLPQSIAKGLVGADAAYSGGWRTAGLGLVLHCVIAFGWTLVYFAAVRQVDWIRRKVRNQPVIGGLIYGALVWIAMTVVVMPLSRAGGTVFDWLWLINLGQHAIMVGLPIAWLVREG